MYTVYVYYVYINFNAPVLFRSPELRSYRCWQVSFQREKRLDRLVLWAEQRLQEIRKHDGGAGNETALVISGVGGRPQRGKFRRFFHVFLGGWNIRWIAQIEWLRFYICSDVSCKYDTLYWWFRWVHVVISKAEHRRRWVFQDSEFSTSNGYKL